MASGFACPGAPGQPRGLRAQLASGLRAGAWQGRPTPVTGQSVAGAALCAGTGPKGQDGRHRRRILAAMGRVLDLPRLPRSGRYTVARTATLNRQNRRASPWRQCASRLGISSANSKPLRPRWKSVKAPAQTRAFEILNSSRESRSFALGAPGDWLARPQGGGQSNPAPGKGTASSKGAGEGCARRSTCRLSQRSPVILTWPGSIASSARPASRRR